MTKACSRTSTIHDRFIIHQLHRYSNAETHERQETLRRWWTTSKKIVSGVQDDIVTEQCCISWSNPKRVSMNEIYVTCVIWSVIDITHRFCFTFLQPVSGTCLPWWSVRELENSWQSIIFQFSAAHPLARQTTNAVDRPGGLKVFISEMSGANSRGWNGWKSSLRMLVTLVRSSRLLCKGKEWKKSFRSWLYHDSSSSQELRTQASQLRYTTRPLWIHSSPKTRTKAKRRARTWEEDGMQQIARRTFVGRPA